jgi:probable HAF family extracellular repeat protein
MQDLGTLGGNESEAFGINEAGQIVGVSDISSDEFHAFLTSRCTPPDASSSGGGGGGCFIATAAYGSYWEPHVMTLRQFRDSYLLKNKLGTKFVETYYKYSPSMADYIAEHDSLRSVARVGLAPLVGFSFLAINYGMMAALAVLFGVLTMIMGGVCLVVNKREANLYLK